MPLWDPVKLQKTLVERLSVSDLRQVVFELGIPFSDLPGDTRVDKTRELVLYLAQRGRLDHLIHWLHTNRDDIDTTTLASDLTSPPHPPDADTQQAQLSEWYDNGLAAFYLKRWDEAIQLFGLIVAQNPDYEQAAAKLAEAKRRQYLDQLQLAAANAEAEQRWTDAIHAWEALLALDPKHAATQGRLEAAQRQQRLAEHYAEARRLYRAQQWQAVVHVFEQMHALDAKYPDAEGLLKEAHKALADLERERKAAALYSEGLRHIDAQTWNEALRCFQAIEKIVKDYRDTPALLTQVRHELEVIRRRQEQAQAEQARREELARAEKTRQEEEARQAQVARLTREINALWQQLETAEANQDWRMVIRRAKSILNRDPSHRRAKNKLAAGYAGRSQTYQPGERQQAIDDLTRAIELVPNQADLYARRATYKFGQAALADLEKALELRPGHAEYKRQRDALKKELADRAARDEAQRALWDGLKSLGLGGKASSGSEPPASVKPSMPGSFEWSGLSLPPKLIFTAKEADEQGVAQAQRGDHRRAITYFDRAIELAPDTAEFYAHRALSYHRLADYARAITDYDRAMDLGRADIALFQNRNRAAEHQPPKPLLI